METMEMLDKLEARIRAAEAERGTARAGEARAVDALKSVRGSLDDISQYCANNQFDDIKTVMDFIDGAIYKAELTDAAGWLAQQRREAVAEALKEVAKLIRQTNRTPYGGDVAPFEIGKWEGRQYAAEQIEARAAELRKGKGE